MKTVKVVAVLLSVAMFQIACSQDKKGKKTVEKNIEVSIENGKHKVVETITENGKTTTNTYEGKEAEDYIAEHHKDFKEGKHKGNKTSITVDIETDDENDLAENFQFNFDSDEWKDLSEDEIEAKVREMVKQHHGEDANVKIEVSVDDDNSITIETETEGKSETEEEKIIIKKKVKKTK